MMANMSLDELITDLGLDNSAELARAIHELQLELPLAALRKASGVTQSEMAKRLGKSQAAVSKFEGRGDFLCSTFYSYARAIGADVRMNVRVKGQVFDLCQNESDGGLYFSLKERLAACDAVKSEQVIELRDYVESSAKRKRTTTPDNFVWGNVERTKGHVDTFINVKDLLTKTNANIAITA